MLVVLLTLLTGKESGKLTKNTAPGEFSVTQNPGDSPTGRFARTASETSQRSSSSSTTEDSSSSEEGYTPGRAPPPCKTLFAF